MHEPAIVLLSATIKKETKIDIYIYVRIANFDITVFYVDTSIKKASRFLEEYNSVILRSLDHGLLLRLATKDYLHSLDLENDNIIRNDETVWYWSLI